MSKLKMNPSETYHVPVEEGKVEDCGDNEISDADMKRMDDRSESIMAAAPEMYEVLKLYEELEAELTMNNDAWVYGLPRFTQRLYDNWMEIQTKRNEALAKARGGGAE